MSAIKGLEVTEWQPTAPMDLIDPRQIEPVPQESQLDRIERKLDALIGALAEEDDHQPRESLDGTTFARSGQEGDSL